MKVRLPENPGAHEQRTYFLVREEIDSLEARSMAWEMFESSSRFIDRMQHEVSDLGDPSARQLHNENNTPRRYGYAIVHLGWSGLSFVICRGNDQDLQELVRHVGCAWHADDKGKIFAAEFRIEVTLKV